MRNAVVTPLLARTGIWEMAIYVTGRAKTSNLQFYNGISYNKSKYDSSYATVAGGVETVVPVAGKQVPLTHSRFRHACTS